MNYKHPDHPPGPLPREHAGILNFHLHTAPEEFGFYPWTDTPAPDFDPATHKAVPSDPIDLDAKTSTRVWEIVPLDEDDLPPLAYLKEDASSRIYAEREERLAAGFDFDFGDARGVHHVGTSEADMKGWDEVTKWSDAAIALGQADTTMTILTGSGPAEITALEWKQVLLASTAFRQPIWHASFALLAAVAGAADRAVLHEIDIEGGWLG